MLPFAMRSAPIPAGVAGSASRAAISSRAPRLSTRTSAPPRGSDRFVHPLFSYRYKPLVPQVLCIHIYTKHPGVSVVSFFATQGSLCSTSSCNSFVISSLHALVLSWPSFSQSFCLFSIACGLFCEMPGGGVPLRCSRSQRARIFRAATWTPLAHPTIIGVTSRFQVHG
jgi:hypothetical protein